MAAWQIYVKNNFSYAWDSNLDLLGYVAGTADQKGWFECHPTAPSPGVPESGC